jgi:ABC-type glycerol-3-phosphate transport system permease component
VFLDAQVDVTRDKENLRMVAGVFMSLFPLTLFFIFQKQLIEGVVTTGIKD